MSHPPAPPSSSSPLSTEGLAALPAAAREVLAFWFADGLQSGWPTVDMGKRWFGGGAALDAEIEARFGDLVREAASGGLQDWEASPWSRLALVILLDQFSRNVFRGSAQAFAGDGRALRLAEAALQAGEDRQLPWVARVFMYMPLMHTEGLAGQERCVNAFTQLLEEGPEALARSLQGHLDYAIQHRDIVARFGRFPHRNAVLARASTPQEEDFLRTGPRFGQ